MDIQWLKEATNDREQISAYRQKLHACAETGFDLPKTTAVVSAALSDLGLVPQKTGRSGITATIGNGSPAVILRADMDALPIREKTGLGFASKNGNMHTCGHDIHTAMLLGAAGLLCRHRHALNGCIKLAFQPAEELLEGAADMLANGLLEGSQSCVALMLHVMSNTGMKTGTIVIPNAGVSAPAADMFRISVHGKACHGAMPHTGADPINAAAHILLALQSITTREMGLNEAHALTIGSFRAGEASNAIPDEAVLQGSVRSYDVRTQQFLRKRIEEMTKATANVFRTAAQVSWLSGCPPLLNNGDLVEKAKNILPAAIGSERVITADNLHGKSGRSVGSEDFAYISQQIPSLMLAVAAGGEYPLHHPSLVFDEDVLPYGTAAYAAFAAAVAGEMQPS